MVLPEKFLLMDFVKLPGKKLVVALVGPRNGRRIKGLLRGPFERRNIHLSDERGRLGTGAGKQVRRQTVRQAKKLFEIILLCF